MLYASALGACFCCWRARRRWDDWTGTAWLGLAIALCQLVGFLATTLMEP